VDATIVETNFLLHKRGYKTGPFIVLTSGHDLIYNKVMCVAAVVAFVVCWRQHTRRGKQFNL
jgi:predicted ABC-type sugar transport system permease subunit